MQQYNNDAYDIIFSRPMGKLGAAVMRELDGKEVKFRMTDFGALYSQDPKHGIREILIFDINGDLQELRLPNARVIPNDFLSNDSCQNLAVVDLPNAEYIGDNFLTNAPRLVQLNIPKVRKIGCRSLMRVPTLLKFDAPILQEAYIGLMEDASRLQELNIPSLEQIKNATKGLGHCTFSDLTSLKKLNAPKLRSAPNGILQDNDFITKVELPNIESLGSFVFTDWTALREINLPNVTECMDYVLDPKDCKNLQVVNAPKLVKAGIGCHPLVYEAVRRNTAHHK